MDNDTMATPRFNYSVYRGSCSDLFAVTASCLSFSSALLESRLQAEKHCQDCNGSVVVDPNDHGYIVKEQTGKQWLYSVLPTLPLTIRD